MDAGTIPKFISECIAHCSNYAIGPFWAPIPPLPDKIFEMFLYHYVAQYMYYAVIVSFFSTHSHKKKSSVVFYPYPHPNLGIFFNC